MCFHILHMFKIMISFIKRTQTQKHKLNSKNNDTHIYIIFINRILRGIVFHLLIVSNQGSN